MSSPLLISITPAPEGGEGLRISVRRQDGGVDEWKALEFQMILVDEPPPNPEPRK